MMEGCANRSTWSCREPGRAPGNSHPPVCTGLAGPHFGPARQAGDRTQTTPFDWAQRASVDPTNGATSSLAASVAHTNGTEKRHNILLPKHLRFLPGGRSRKYCDM